MGEQKLVVDSLWFFHKISIYRARLAIDQKHVREDPPEAHDPDSPQQPRDCPQKSKCVIRKSQTAHTMFPGCSDERQMVEPAGGPPVRPWYGTRTGTTRKIPVSIQSLFSLAISTPP
uniref:(northern house mosquito) hypothetical protein n=1 Tax=Culex pipiens TaxID=7175 RepID=A0A8D8AU23_CULPI